MTNDGVGPFNVQRSKQGEGPMTNDEAGAGKLRVEGPEGLQCNCADKCVPKLHLGTRKCTPIDTDTVVCDDSMEPAGGSYSSRGAAELSPDTVGHGIFFDMKTHLFSWLLGRGLQKWPQLLVDVAKRRIVGEQRFVDLSEAL